MMLYNVQRQNIALSTTADFMTLISGATRSFLILEIDAEGDGTSSLYNEFGIYRVGTAGVTGASAVTPTPIDTPNMTGTTPALAFSGLVWGGWTTQPVLGALIQQCPINNNGQRYFWRCNPNRDNAIPVPGGNNAAGSISIRSIVGTGSVSIRLQIAEI